MPVIKRNYFWNIVVCLLVRFCHVLVYECGVVVWFCLVVVASFVRFNKNVFVLANFFKIFALEAVRVEVGFKLNALYHLKHTVFEFIQLFYVWWGNALSSTPRLKVRLKKRKDSTQSAPTDRNETSACRNSFITMKDHKPDFLNNPTCRLINPSKSEIGIISKHILDDINKKILQATKVNLWKSTSNAIEWFKSIPEKEKQVFITFDVCDFYPSITEEPLLKSLEYASKFTSINPEDRQIIIHAKKSLLFHQNSPWTQKKPPTTCST